jgi:hypothetical protein
MNSVLHYCCPNAKTVEDPHVKVWLTPGEPWPAGSLTRCSQCKQDPRDRWIGHALTDNHPVVLVDHLAACRICQMDPMELTAEQSRTFFTT